MQKRVSVVTTHILKKKTTDFFFFLLKDKTETKHILEMAWAPGKARGLAAKTGWAARHGPLVWP